MHYGYILRGQITGLYKVGISGNVRRRFSQYKTHTPERITIEAVKSFVSEDEAKDWERWILREYEESIEHGEWLNIDFGEAATIWNFGFTATTNWLSDQCKVMVQRWWSSEKEAPLIRVFCCPDKETAAILRKEFDVAHPSTDWPRMITQEWIDRERVARAERSIKRQAEWALA